MNLNYFLDFDILKAALILEILFLRYLCSQFLSLPPHNTPIIIWFTDKNFKILRLFEHRYCGRKKHPLYIVLKLLVEYKIQFTITWYSNLEFQI
jgi:hypothetical protein